MTQRRHATSAGVEIDRLFVDYDAVGKPKAKRTLATAATFSYDVRDQLTQEARTPGVLTTWTYDIAGRRTSQVIPGLTTSYSYDAADQLLLATAAGLLTTYSYDANGSTLLVQTPTGQTATYAWDAVNRLQSVTQPNGATSSNIYRFDDLLSKMQNSQGTRQLIWEGGNVLAHLRSDSFGHSVAFIKTDTTTQGSWPYVYGSEGRDIQSLTPVLPAYLTLNITGASTNVWNSNTTDVRAMISVPGSSVRVAADWFSAGDSVMAGAAPDRLLHRCTVVNIRGESYRLREKRQAGILNIEPNRLTDADKTGGK